MSGHAFKTCRTKMFFIDIRQSGIIPGKHELRYQKLYLVPNFHIKVLMLNDIDIHRNIDRFFNEITFHFNNKFQISQWKALSSE